jgi:uncharacterized membrane protein HdeD (DUF308 family)
MSGSWKLALTLFAVVVIGFFAIKIVISTTLALVSLLLPLAIVGGVAYLLYSMISRKPLGGGRRTLP